MTAYRTLARQAPSGGLIQLVVDDTGLHVREVPSDESVASIPPQNVGALDVATSGDEVAINGPGVKLRVRPTAGQTPQKFVADLQRAVHDAPPSIAAPVEQRPARMDVAALPHTRAAPVRICGSCGGQSSDRDAQFCARCGAELAEPTVEDEIAAIRTEIEVLREQLGEMRSDMSRLASKADGIEARADTPAVVPSRVAWVDLPEEEKWSVWWGVTWRGAVISIGIYALVFLIALALSG